MNTNDIVDLYKEIIRDKNRQMEELINAKDQLINAKDQLIMAKDHIIKVKDESIEIQKKDFKKYLNFWSHSCYAHIKKTYYY
jgi:hypothetical protein